jgi:DNA-binding SARP family transcriptional activator
MGFRLLGPVEVWAVSGRVEVGPPRQCAVLAALAADAGRPVPVDALVRRVWGDDPPERARRTLHTYVTRIRRIVEQARPAGDRSAGVVLRAAGYLLDVDPDRVDLHRFRRLVMQAGARQAGDEERLTLLREAVGLWRGQPLAGVAGDWADRMRQAWRQLYLDAIVCWADAELRGGDPAAVVGPVGQLAGEYPLVEPLAAALLRALAATGRAAEALDRFAALRRLLAEAVGSEPGPELQAVHQAILRGELTPQRATTHVPARRVPAQLPADVPAFTGRQAELATLDNLLAGTGGHRDTAPRSSAGTQPAAATPPATPPAAAVQPAAGSRPAAGARPPGSVLICALSGTAGVGKTALAIHWAHRVRARYPDGQLYLDLRGYDADQPVDPAAALARFLLALGVPERDIPRSLDERAARYRTELAGRHVLIVLDNAEAVEQVRPLLPGTPSCLVLVTSRDSLGGLVALHGAHRVELDLLPLPDALALLRRLLGSGRLDAEPDTAVTLANRCARLPLALRVAAELTLDRPGASLAELAAELDDEQHRLDVLDSGGDPRAAVRTVFSWSYQRLPAEAGQAFQQLGLHPGPEFDASALAGTGTREAAHTLRLLARSHLIHPTGAGRYGMHDLLRAYARSLALDGDAADRCAAVTLPFVGHRRARGGPDTDPPAVHGRPRHAARPTADVAGSAPSLRGLGAGHPRRGRHEVAAAHHRETHELR